MTIKRVKNLLHAPHYRMKEHHKRAMAASSYFSAAMISLFVAGIVLALGWAAIDYDTGSFIEERPMINIVVPPENIRDF